MGHVRVAFLDTFSLHSALAVGFVCDFPIIYSPVRVLLCLSSLPRGHGCLAGLGRCGYIKSLSCSLALSSVKVKAQSSQASKSQTPKAAAETLP